MKTRYAVIPWQTSYGAMFHHLSDNTADDMVDFIEANVEDGLQPGELDQAFAELMERWNEIDMGGRPRPPTVKALLWAVKDLRSGKVHGALCIGCKNSGWIYDPDASDYPTGAFIPCDCPRGTRVMHAQYPNADHQSFRRRARLLMSQITPPIKEADLIPRLKAATPAQRWDIICDRPNTADCIYLERLASRMAGGISRPDFKALPNPFTPTTTAPSPAELERRKAEAKAKLQETDDQDAPF